MKKHVLVLLAGIIFSTTVFAQVRPGMRPPRNPSPPRYGNEFGSQPTHPPSHWNRDSRGYIDHNNRKYVPTVNACGVTHVRFMVYGDNLMIKEMDILFNNRQSQNLAFGRTFPQGHSEAWQALRSWGGACIDGLFIDAFSERDWDMDDSYVVIYGWTQFGREIELTNVRIKDWNSHRGFRRGPPPGHVRPGPVHPGPAPIHPPRVAPTQRYESLGAMSAPKIITNIKTFDVNRDFVTEFKIRADKNHVMVKTAYATDKYGRRIDVIGLLGSLRNGSEKAARISDVPVGIQSITLEIMTDNIFKNTADLIVEVGLAR